MKFVGKIAFYIVITIMMFNRTEASLRELVHIIKVINTYLFDSPDYPVVGLIDLRLPNAW